MITIQQKRQFKKDMLFALIKGELSYEDIALQFVIAGHDKEDFSTFVRESKILIAAAKAA